MSAAAEALDLDAIAAATYAAMTAKPASVLLADALLATDTREARAALLREAGATTAADALAYLAEPEATRERDRGLDWMRADPRRIAALRHYYAGHHADFICGFALTTDPRRVAKGQPAQVRFDLWPRQRELVEWMLDRWRRGERGVVVKCRDAGASYVSAALLVTLCVFERSFAAGIASSTEAKLDLSGSPDTLFAKIREFARVLPPEFNGGYSRDRTDNYLRISFPETGSSITGEAGDQAGRGARKSVYVVDESAFFEHPRVIDASLAATTDCRIDISTPNGIGNSFYDAAHNPAIPRFDLGWRDDPRKDDAWYRRQVETLDPVVLAQEVNADFAASREGVVIPSAWAQASIGLAEKLGIERAGARYAALDLGDQGDRSALAVRHGIEVLHVGSWSGAGSDLLRSVGKAFALCDEWEVTQLAYDADGLGSAARGDARVLNDAREDRGQTPIRIEEYRGSSSPIRASSKVPRTGRTWADLVANRKAQAFYSLRLRFQEAAKAARGEPFDAADLISISPTIPELPRLLAELSQPTMRENAAGRLLIDKLGDGERSPNLADALCMVMAPRNLGWSNISQAALDAI